MQNVDELDLDVVEVGRLLHVFPPLPRVAVDQLRGLERDGEAPVVGAPAHDPRGVDEAVERALQPRELAEDGRRERGGARAHGRGGGGS